MGGNKLKIEEKVYDKTPGVQKVLTDISNISLEKLIDEDNEKIINNLESLFWEIQSKTW